MVTTGTCLHSRKFLVESVCEKIVQETVGKKATEIDSSYRINCFTTVISYFNDQLQNGKTTAQEMLDWLQANTTQVLVPSETSIVIFWSSSDVSVSPDLIDINILKRDSPGYPFGLVMEHAAVFISKEEVFQKASPKDEDGFEVVHYSKILSAYCNRFPWLRITIHELN